jgi:hypothetical protein
MNKKIIILLTVFTSLTAFLSCEDVLDRTPLDKISDGDVWQNESLLQSYVIDLYNRFPSFAFVDMFNFGDEATGSGGNSNAVTMGTMSKSNIPSQIEYWDYEFIRDCNIFLEKINQTPISDDLKHQLEGEVTVMRAVSYFEMAKRYGGVPLVTNVIDPYKPIPEDLQKRKTEVEIYDFVDTELAKATQLLEKNIGKTPTARINKWTALAFQSRSNLWAASIAKFGTVQLNGLVGVPSARANDFYKKASDAASLVLGSGIYSLYNGNSDKAKNYQNIILAEGNSEILFAREYNGVEKKHDWDHWKAPSRFASGQGSRCNPTLDLILQYENIDGTDEDYTQYFNVAHLYKNGLDIFKKKDPRLFGTVLFQGSFFTNDYIQTYEGIDTAKVANTSKIVNNPNLSYNGLKQVGVDSRLVIGDDKTTNSGFLIRKWCDEPNLPVPAGSSQVDWPIMRLAEVYLTKAEADFQLTHLADAVTALNATRARAGISLVDANTISMKKIQTEWMAEFSFENKRYWDLRRWRIAESLLNKQFSGLKIIWHYASNDYYFLPLFCETSNRVFRSENYYNPIASSRINNNPLLIQNPLY